MKNTIKVQKGITLLALIITIVVLLILAGVAISSITQFKIVENANATVALYNEAQVDEKYKLEDYNDWIEKYMNQSGTVVTLFEGNEKTNEDGMILLGENDLFVEGILGAKYKIEIESDIYTGAVEVLPTYLGIGEDNAIVYALFAIENGKIIKFTSVEDFGEKYGDLTEDSIFVSGVKIGGMSALIIQGEKSSEVIVKKIERTGIINTKKIYDGNFKLKNNEYVVVPNLNEKLDYTRKYLFCMKIDGIEYNIVLDKSTPIGSDGLGIYAMAGEEIKVLSSKIGIYCGDSEWEDIILTKIYELGPSGLYVKEGEFCVYNVGEEGWALVATPDTTYVVPEKVGDKVVSVVIMDNISGSPIFNKAVDLKVLETRKKFNTIKLTVADMLYNILDSAVVENLDLTGCGDELEFSNDILYYINNDGALKNVYVTPNVKAKYPDNTKIVAK